MITLYRQYASVEDIPVAARLGKRKLLKYFTREAMAAVLTATELAEGNEFPRDIPFYYASSYTENIQYMKGVFERLEAYPEHYFEAGQFLQAIPPTAHFKAMRNMVPCFISVELGLKGDNNVIVDSASALLYCALTAPGEGPILIGAGYLHEDDSVEAGFALVTPSELAGHPLLGTDATAIEIFRPCR